MEVLPYELWMMISGHLTLPERCHLAQTCVHLYGVMSESISSFLKVEELVISSDRDILSKEFLLRYMSTQIRKLKIVIPELTRKCVDFLRDVFDVCSSVEGLEIQTGKNWCFVEELNAIFATISIREFHAKVMVPGIIIPRSVEKCTMPSNTFEKMFKLHKHRLQELQDAASSPDSEPPSEPFLNGLRNLVIHFDEDLFKWVTDPYMLVLKGEATTPSIWTFISEIHSLEELSFNDWFARYLADFRLARNTFNNVKTLRLNVYLSFEDIAIMLQKFRCLEILYFNLSSSSLIHNARSRLGLFKLPSTLKELHVHGIVYGGDPENLQMNTPDRGLWTSLFGACKEAPIEIVSQNYTFLKETAPMALAPGLGSSYRDLMDKVGCSAFKSLYFHIRFPWQWTYIKTHLQEFPHLEHLHLFVWLHDEYEVGEITVASPMITTSIKLLTVDDNHFHHDTSFWILSSFSNVGEYAINCDPGSQLFATCRDWNQSRGSTVPWRLQLDSGGLPYDQLRDFAYIKKLTLGRILNLNALSIAAPSMEVLFAEGGQLCIKNVIASCLRFSKLRLAHFWKITSEITKEQLDDIASNGEYHRRWPSHLENFIFTTHAQLGTRAREIRIIRDEFRIKVLDSMGEIKWGH